MIKELVVPHKNYDVLYPKFMSHIYDNLNI